MKRKIIRLPLNQTEIDTTNGLTSTQVKERKEKNHINKVKIGHSKSIWSILYSNIFNVFNFLCFFVFAWILTVSTNIADLKNCIFMVIITCNIVIGVVQELKAKRIIDKLSLTVSPKSKVIRDGKPLEINMNEVVRDDIVVLESGSQINNDSVVVSGECEVNESMLTGESLPIKKQVGDTVLSGSFVISGKCLTQVTNIAEENYIQKLALEARQFKTAKSELMRDLTLLLKVLAIIVVVFAIPSFINNFSANLDKIINHDGFWASVFHLGDYTSEQLAVAYKETVMSTSTVLIGMIPSGLMLLTSLALVVGVMKIAKQKALVQGLYSIETLARVNMLCLDKTGTLTDGTMEVKDVLRLSEDYTLDYIKEIVSSIQGSLDDNNATSCALKDYFGKEIIFSAKNILNFNSDLKYSGVEFEEKGVYLLGAPEYVNSLNDELKTKIDSFAEMGLRCLMLAKAESLDNNKNSVPLAIITLEDNIKKSAPETLRYFKENNVAIRIISGDNPVTVSHIAKKVGVEGYEKYISLQDMGDEDVVKASKEYIVFGRVNPHQKKLLIKSLKEQGNTVAMTGDGINDILAMKESDCAVAMANGCSATRNVAHIVLMDSDFASMPHIVGEGRRVVNNVERASVLFLTKTLMTFLVQILYIILQMQYPLIPIQLSYIDFFAIGVPSFFIALEPNNKRIEGNFFNNIFKRIVPCATLIFINVLIVTLLNIFGVVNFSANELSTVIAVAIYSVFIALLIELCKPFNKWRIGLLALIFVTSGIMLFLAPLSSNPIINIFSFENVYAVDKIIIILTLFVFSYFALKPMRKFSNKFLFKEKKVNG